MKNKFRCANFCLPNLRKQNPLRHKQVREVHTDYRQLLGTWRALQSRNKASLEERNAGQFKIELNNLILAIDLDGLPALSMKRPLQMEAR